MQRLKLKKILPLLIILITSVVIVIIITYIILYVRPIWQQYTIVESGSIIDYQNDRLDVDILITYENNINDVENNQYLARWGERELRGNTTEELMDRISLYSGHMSEDQFKWFEYMLTHVVK